MTGAFGTRLSAAIAARGGLCVGIDPHPATLAAWGLPVSAAGAERFASAVIDAAAGRIGVVKPQVSLFECYGSRGFAALERILARARETGLLVIADAKRGDIGTSNAGYARAWLGQDAPLRCDALTVSPYLGVGALAGLRDAALAAGAGLFVLAATSNPEADAAQGSGQPSVAARVAAAVAEWNRFDATPAGPDAEDAGADRLGSFGIVFGATGAPAARGLDARRTPGDLPVLAPGFGAQGGDLRRVAALFPGCRRRLLASVSRSVTAAGPDRLTATIGAAAAHLAAGWDVPADQPAQN